MNLSELADLAAALGNEKRLRLLKRLAAGPANSGELCAALGGANVTTMRDHLKKLIAAGFVVASEYSPKTYFLEKERMSELRLWLKIKLC